MSLMMMFSDFFRVSFRDEGKQDWTTADDLAREHMQYLLLSSGISTSPYGPLQLPITLFGDHKSKQRQAWNHKTRVLSVLFSLRIFDTLLPASPLAWHFSPSPDLRISEKKFPISHHNDAWIIGQRCFATKRGNSCSFKLISILGNAREMATEECN